MIDVSLYEGSSPPSPQGPGPPATLCKVSAPPPPPLAAPPPHLNARYKQHGNLRFVLIRGVYVAGFTSDPSDSGYAATRTDRSCT